MLIRISPASADDLLQNSAYRATPDCFRSDLNLTNRILLFAVISILISAPVQVRSQVEDMHTADDQDNHVLENLVADSAAGSLVEGRMNWTTGDVTVTGEGFVDDAVTHPVQRRLLGLRAAKVDAYRKLLEVLGAVQVDTRTTVSMAMVASDSIRTHVMGVVRGARVVPGSQREEDGYYRLDLSLSLRGDLANAVLPDSTADTRGEPVDLPLRDSLVVFVPPQPHTGLVVDARGTALRPSMSPRIVDDTGRVIYAASHVDRDFAVQTGVVAYDRDLQHAVISDRVGGETANPFLVKAIRVSGLYNGDVVVTRDMGTRIRMADMEADFLTECRVVFVVGPAPPAPAPEFSAAATSEPNLMPRGDFLDSILQTRAATDSLPIEGASP